MNYFINLLSLSQMCYR